VNIPGLKWRFEQRSLWKLSGELETENKSVFSSSSSLIWSFSSIPLLFDSQNPSWSHVVLELRRYEFNDEDSWRISENSWWFEPILHNACWIVSCIDEFAMNLDEFFKFWNQLGFLLWMFLKLFLEILVFDLFWSERELETCFFDFGWVGAFWMAWQWLGAFYRLPSVLLDQLDLDTWTWTYLARPWAICGLWDLFAILKDWGTNLQNRKLKGQN
jgi:hypothetical protein